jgi:SAM-dependent methyltransferase
MFSAIKNVAKKITPGKYHPHLKQLKDKVFNYRWIFYLGSEFLCPFCQKRFRKFFPIGLDDLGAEKYCLVGHGRREHCYCPRCSSLDRERLAYLYLLKKTNIFKDKAALLHIAPEKNLQQLFMACPNIDYLSADLSMDCVMVKMDVTDIQYATNTFDIIICNHVLQYVPDDLRAVSELYRVLKPGGWALLQVPISLALDCTYNFPPDRKIEDPECAYDSAVHARIYARDYQERLESAGFQVEKFRWADHLEDFGGPGNRYALIPEEILYIASKPRLSA